MALKQPDWERAEEYVLARLEAELAPDLYYHSIRHTRDDVLPAAERLARLARLDGEETLLLRTAALYHDIGFVEQYWYNEPIAVRIAEETLPGFGYDLSQVRVIGNIIVATQLPQSPQTFLEALLCDADLDSLGREDFVVTSHNLKLELAAHGQTSTIAEWYETQIAFLTAHSYWTRVAEVLRGAQKRRNLAELRRSLAALNSQHHAEPPPQVEAEPVNELIASPSFPRRAWSGPAPARVVQLSPQAPPRPFRSASGES